MLHRSLLGAAVAAVLLLAPATSPAAAPATVRVRVEGRTQTLVPQTTVTTSAAPVVKDAHECPGTSDGGALDTATGGDWAATYNATYDAFLLQSIEGEAPGGGDYWSVWINGRYAQLGTCRNELQQGDDLLYFVDHCDYDAQAQTCTNPPVLPLELSGPRAVRLGAPFTVTVVSRGQDGAATPIAGATVSRAGQTATTDAAGHAALTLTTRGDSAFTATKPGLVRTGPVPFCATDGADGFCGTTTPGEPAAAPPPGCATTGDDGLCGTFDRHAPLARIAAIRQHQRFSRAKAPKQLSGTVDPDPSGIKDVELRLTRWAGPRCATFDGTRERFVRMPRCGAARGRWFSVGDRQSWSYLLPAQLVRGRYVLDVRATDKNGNAGATLQPARNRVVFWVS